VALMRGELENEDTAWNIRRQFGPLENQLRHLAGDRV